MKKQQQPIDFFEFQTVWLKCVSAMDRLIMEKGYEALTSENICKYTGLTEKAIDAYFGSMDILLKMHDGIILLEQQFKTKYGNYLPE